MLTEQNLRLESETTKRGKALQQQEQITKREKERATSLEKRLDETTKKYDDSKKAYFKQKEARETYRQENERLKAEGKQEADVSASTETANKYEQLKIKYRVSSFFFFQSLLLISHLLTSHLSLVSGRQNAKRRIARCHSPLRSQSLRRTGRRTLQPNGQSLRMHQEPRDRTICLAIVACLASINNDG